MSSWFESFCVTKCKSATVGYRNSNGGRPVSVRPPVSCSVQQSDCGAIQCSRTQRLRLWHIYRNRVRLWLQVQNVLIFLGSTIWSQFFAHRASICASHHKSSEMLMPSNLQHLTGVIAFPPTNSDARGFFWMMPRIISFVFAVCVHAVVFGPEFKIIEYVSMYCRPDHCLWE